MTDKTDIAALTRPVRDRYDWSNAVWRDCDQCGKRHTGTVTAEDGSQICAHCADQLYWSAWQVLAERALDQLEAERQLAATLQAELDEFRFRLKLERSILEDADKEIAKLKGDQVPVAWLNDAHLARGHIEGEAGEEDAGPGMIPVYREQFTSQEKPVSPPVGEIVAWSGTNNSMGITREVDFRFLRFDVKPGTKLYAIEPPPEGDERSADK